MSIGVCIMNENKRRKPVIGVANQKGGVGKTTISRLIAEFLAIIIKIRVLLIDLDPQTSLTNRFFGIRENPITGYKEPPLHPSYNPDKLYQDSWDGKSSIADIYFGRRLPTAYPTKIDKLDIIPADEGQLFKVAEIKRKEIIDHAYKKLNEFLSLKSVQTQYDVIVLDTPPAKDSPFTIGAFKAMSHLIIPLEAEYQALEGLSGLLQLWKNEALHRPRDNNLELVGILLNKIHSRRSLDEDIIEQLRNQQTGQYIIPVELVDRAEIPTSDKPDGESIFYLPKSNVAKQEAVTACQYIYERIMQ